MFGFGGPFGGLWHVLMSIFMFFGGVLLIAVFVVVTVLLVRFLLVATRAATLYVDRHSTDRPDADRAAPTAVSPTTPVAPAKPAARRTTSPTPKP